MCTRSLPLPFTDAGLASLRPVPTTASGIARPSLVVPYVVENTIGDASSTVFMNFTTSSYDDVDLNSVASGVVLRSAMDERGCNTGPSRAAGPRTERSEEPAACAPCARPRSFHHDPLVHTRLGGPVAERRDVVL